MEKVKNFSSDENMQTLFVQSLSAVLLALSFLFMVNGLGIKFALYLMIVFVCKEIGYFWSMKHKGLNYYPAYVLPFPYPFGCLGTFRSIKSISSNPKLDIHVHSSGIFFAFIASLALMILGLKASGFEGVVEHGFRFTWGQSLLSTFLHFIFKLEPQPDILLSYHPMYLAGLAGSFTCALSLLPIGQLNGGYIARHVVGPKYIWLSGIVCFALFVLGFTHHYVWHMIMSMFLLFTYHHNTEEADIKKPNQVEYIKVFMCLLIFILCFMPRPYVFAI